MKQLEELQKEERQMQSIRDSIIDEEKQIRRIKEDYEQHFSEARHYLDNLCCQFHKSDQNIFFQSVIDEYYLKSRQVMENIEIDEVELHHKQQKLLDEIETIGYMKKKLSAEEEKK